jgi:hypothetical protein
MSDRVEDSDVCIRIYIELKWSSASVMGADLHGSWRKGTFCDALFVSYDAGCTFGSACVDCSVGRPQFAGWLSTTSLTIFVVIGFYKSTGASNCFTDAKKSILLLISLVLDGAKAAC